MPIKLLISVLAFCTLNFASGQSITMYAQTKGQHEELEGKIKARVVKLAGDPEAHVQVKLKDGRVVKGYITEVADNAFVISDRKTAATYRFTYAEVKQVKNKTHVDNALSDPGVLGGLLLLPIILGIAFALRGR
jgi:ribosomal protein S1